MSKKRDPLTAIISYFTTAELAQVAQTLVIVKEIARSRLAPSPQAKPRAARRTTPSPVARAASLEN